MKTNHILVLFMILLSLSLPGQPWAQSKNLVLETQPEPTTIPITGTVAVATDGTISVTPTEPTSACKQSGSCEGVEVSVESFSSSALVNGTITVEEGENAVLDWRSLGAVSCVGAGDFGNWSERVALPPDSRDATVAQRTLQTEVGDAAGSPYGVKLQCRNGTINSADTSAATISLVVEEYIPPSPTSCEGRLPPSGWQRLTTGSLTCHFASGIVTSSDCRDWVSVWKGTFLESGGKPRTIMTNVSTAKQYVAMQFTTNGMSAMASGQLSAEGPASGVLAEPIIATISKCPGDFSPEQITGCYLKPGSTSQLTWRGPDAASNSTCILEPDTTYYLNLISTLSPLGTGTQDIEENAICEDNRCGIQLTPRFNN